MESNLICIEFIRLLELAIPASEPSREAILAAAHQLIPRESVTKLLNEINDPVVKRAYLLYYKRRTQHRNQEPSLPDLIHWLRGRAGFEYANQLERRLALLREYLYAIGSLPVTDMVQVPVQWVVGMRFLVDDYYECFSNVGEGQVEGKSDEPGTKLDMSN